STQTPASNESPLAQPTPSASPAAPAVETPPPPPAAQPSETPSIATPTPNASPLPTENPASATPTSQPSEAPAAMASPSPATQTLLDTTPLETKTSTPVAGPTRSPNPTRRTANPATVTANPEDELEEVELTLTLPVDKRIDALKKFIAAHPKSVAVPRANELMVAAHATLGDQKLQAGDVTGGLEQFHLAFSEAPPEVPDRLFTEVLARIPLNLFVRGQRDAAVDAAHQAE